MSLSRPVLDPQRRRVDLSDQRGGLTARVLESLRTFLRYNDRYVQLCVSDNILGSEAMAKLCTLIKRHPHLTALEAQHCDLQDKDFRFYVAPSIATMPHLTLLDLSRNPGLTDTSAEALARIFFDTDVETVRLVGTSLTAMGGRVIASAATNSTSLICCELPFTVGSTVLEDIEASMCRNRLHRATLRNAMAQYTRLRVSEGRLPAVPALKLAEANTMAPMKQLHSPESMLRTPLQPLAIDSGPHASDREADRQLRACIYRGRKHALKQAGAVLTQPSSSTSVVPAQEGSSSVFGTATTAAASFTAAAARSALSATQGGKFTPDLLDKATMWDWADPAISTTLHSLSLLDHQAQLLSLYRAASVVPAFKVQRHSRARAPKKATGVAAPLPHL
ncbi:hypothetical protein LSCM1_03888 [Leishmania martiniquensis]|uniref:Uncharacterized protein n=1 Tax=Leishmania martiniquensis TaxID=1580590 RepID=A0A836KDP3_9TRYP|nr:hypothetical protein LSCM1_03888 [Leishmania martiniquensis]